MFVDGGIDFILRDGTVLETLEITWRYDSFETLYILASHGLSLNAEGTLDEAARQELTRLRSTWPEDFDGSAHVSIDGRGADLEWPRELDLDIINGRLEMTFLRDLSTPTNIAARDVEVAFYESTYFFAFSITDDPQFKGGAATCDWSHIPFVPGANGSALQATLAKLSREETPQMENVGALFADKVRFQCGSL